MADGSGERPKPRPPGTPRWVIGLGIGAIAVLLLVVIVMILGGGDHGPGRHTGWGRGVAQQSPNQLTVG
jgi:hypothetical protein